MAAQTTVQVPHLGGITAGYRISNGAIDPAKPTVILINAMCMTSSLYDIQFESKAITDTVNLLAIEPLGHGATRCPSDHFTYWDSATIALQVMDALGVARAFTLGTSQGGFIIVRMALLAPERVPGIILLGTSMDYESAASREKGCWDSGLLLTPVHESLCSNVPTPDFVINETIRDMVVNLGFSGTITPEIAAFWHETLKSVYSGDDGRRRLLAAMTCLLDRDGLIRRLRDVKCPVYWLQGLEDPVFGTDAPAEHLEHFTASREATLTLVEGGGHYLSATNPKEIEEALLKMVKAYA